MALWLAIDSNQSLLDVGSTLRTWRACLVDYSLASFVDLWQVDVVMSAQVLPYMFTFSNIALLLICVEGKLRFIGEGVFELT